ncbi:MAG: hypothetical protein IPK24_24120 [Kineosporiaceae bacterium]|nr:hypothetical protein [Kineosporiaceae bacterium]
MSNPRVSLVFANHAEFNGQNMQMIFAASEAKVWYEGAADLIDHALFWAQGGALVIVPEEVHPGLLKDVRNFFGTEAIDTLHFPGTSASLCDRIGQDRAGRERMRHWLRGNSNSNLLAWGMTPALASLMRVLEKEELYVQAPGLPSADALWLAQSLDSKPGFRMLAEELGHAHPEVRVPDGFLLPDLDAALATAEDYFLRSGHSVILKAARGTGGYSTLIAVPSVRPEEQMASLRRLRALARFDTFWQVGSVVVERYISGPDGATPAAYTVDACVNRDGSVSIECFGRMLIHSGKRYEGAVMGRGAVNPALAAQLHEVARIFGRALSKRGFTGLFDIDFVVDAEGLPWVCEMNVRRASPSHLLAIALRAFGPSWLTKGAVFGRDYLYLRGSMKMSYEDLRTLAQEYSSQNPAILALLITQASYSLLRRSPHFGYAILAADAHVCEEEAGRFERFVYSSLGLNLLALSSRVEM